MKNSNHNQSINEALADLRLQEHPNVLATVKNIIWLKAPCGDDCKEKVSPIHKHYQNISNDLPTPKKSN